MPIEEIAETAVNSLRSLMDDPAKFAGFVPRDGTFR